MTLNGIIILNRLVPHPSSDDSHHRYRTNNIAPPPTAHWKTWAAIGIVAVFLDDLKDLIVAAVKKAVEAEHSEGKVLSYGIGKMIAIISALLLDGADEIPSTGSWDNTFALTISFMVVFTSEYLHRQHLSVFIILELQVLV
ncbi:hypothetical protein H2201_001179 [Coniosporium apollinis]|uniref:Uncharacterized protein n=1 Tax=Coniosporium apollinis TaxID=61459 RepID=A0ABQ9P3A4_9PEZI|nr:hypothetical protein H2201_001179 [Coniosporium apollinis]